MLLAPAFLTGITVHPEKSPLLVDPLARKNPLVKKTSAEILRAKKTSAGNLRAQRKTAPAKEYYEHN
jgi:hypothetical protein